jgi:hypothetical protein
VRAASAEVVRGARHVRITDRQLPDAGGRTGLDAAVHLLDAPGEDRARYVLVMDAINFGSGWFHELAAEAGEDVTTTMSRRLTEHARARGAAWAPAELRAMDAATIAGVLGQDAAHELMALYARALRDLGAWLGERTALDAIAAAAAGSADRLAQQLAAGMPFFDDRGCFKRAQITANDLVLAGVAAFDDVDELTVFADNLLPHVLRVDGVLEYDDALAARIDAGEELPAGSRAEREIRAATIVACDRLAREAGIAPRILDNVLWNRGVAPPYSTGARLPHRTRTVAY